MSIPTARQDRRLFSRQDAPPGAYPPCMSYQRAVTYLALVILGFVFSDLWRSWWNLTICLPLAAGVWWLRRQQQAR